VCVCVCVCVCVYVYSRYARNQHRWFRQEPIYNFICPRLFSVDFSPFQHNNNNNNNSNNNFRTHAYGKKSREKEKMRETVQLQKQYPHIYSPIDVYWSEQTLSDLCERVYG